MFVASKIESFTRTRPILESLETLYQSDDLKDQDIHTEVYHFLSILSASRAPQEVLGSMNVESVKIEWVVIGNEPSKA